MIVSNYYESNWINIQKIFENDYLKELPLNGLVFYPSPNIYINNERQIDTNFTDCFSLKFEDDNLTIDNKNFSYEYFKNERGYGYAYKNWFVGDSFSKFRTGKLRETKWLIQNTKAKINNNEVDCVFDIILSQNLEPEENPMLYVSIYFPDFLFDFDLSNNLIKYQIDSNSKLYNSIWDHDVINKQNKSNELTLIEPLESNFIKNLMTATKNIKFLFETTEGQLEIELDAELLPLKVEELKLLDNSKIIVKDNETLIATLAALEKIQKNK